MGVAESGNVLALGARDRGFKSLHPYHFGGSSLTGKILECESREQGSSPAFTHICWYRLIGRIRDFLSRDTGSNPVTSTK